jgi:hypothetical protein
MRYGVVIQKLDKAFGLWNDRNTVWVNKIVTMLARMYVVLRTGFPHYRPPKRGELAAVRLLFSR